MTSPALDQQKDHPDVVVFPPVLLLAVIALGVILDRFFPLGILGHLPITPRLIVGLILLWAASLFQPCAEPGLSGRHARAARPRAPAQGRLDRGFDELVQRFRRARLRRQIILVTHNANLIVNADADQVIVATCGPHGQASYPKSHTRVAVWRTHKSAAKYAKY